MKLKKVRVSHFRNIVESGEVRIGDDITCLVGKNESGKTSFLHALYRLNPAIPTPFDVQQHYPAWLEKTHRLQGRDPAKVHPVTVTFELDAGERTEVSQKFGEVVDSFDVHRLYTGALSIVLPFDERKWVATFVEKNCASLFEDGSGPDTAKTLAEHLQRLATSAAQEGQPDYKQVATQALGTLQKEHGKAPDPGNALRQWLESKVPKFLYIGRYDLLPGVIEIQRIAKAKYETLNEGDRVAKALLELAYADPSVAMGGAYEPRKRELENTANALTMEILEYWTQNKDIRVEVDFDQETKENASIVKHLHVRLYDNAHWLSLPFGERSSGFQWFFSFLCAFSRYRMGQEQVILLLDEPALALHARAQADFLRYIEEKLAPNSQVIYTTHSPFMVQAKHLERVRLVEDKGEKRGAKVTEDVLSTDADTMFPLQGALGYDLAQNLFVGRYNLIVEGSSDLVFLQVLSGQLTRLGRTGLDSRCTIVPVGGAEKVATFAALLGSHVDATVLIDSTKKGNQRLEQLVSEGILKRSRLIGVGEINSASEADIEDLFTPEEYLAFFNTAFEKTFKPTELVGNDPIVRRLARLLGVDRYDHGKPASVLLRNPLDFADKLSAATLDAFERLFKRINGTLPE